MDDEQPHNPGYVSLELCLQKHKSLSRDHDSLTAEIATIKNALIGKDLKSGLVSDVHEIKSKLKGSWSGRDKALLIIALINGVVAVTIALCK